MSPREALNLMDQVAASFQGNREDHVKLQSALMVLNGLVSKDEATQEKAQAKAEKADSKPEK